MVRLSCKTEIPLDATGELAFPKRRPYDECVEWIADRLDEVAPLLPPIQTSDKYGAPTRGCGKRNKIAYVIVCRKSFV